MVGTRSQQAIARVERLFDHGALGHLSDAQLLDLFRRNCDANAAFEVLVLRHGPLVRRTCRRILGDPGQADDAFQATFLVLARRAGSVHPANSLGPWLQAVARRIGLKARTAAIRRRYHEQRSAIRLSCDPAPRVDSSEILREEVDRLPEHLRAPVSVDGPGTLSLWVDRGFLMNTLEVPANGPGSEPVLLKIRWSGKMQLTGRTKDAAGRPSCRIQFDGQPHAEMVGGLIYCEERMIVHTTQPVPLAACNSRRTGPRRRNSLFARKRRLPRSMHAGRSP